MKTKTWTLFSISVLVISSSNLSASAPGAQTGAEFEVNEYALLLKRLFRTAKALFRPFDAET